MTDYEKLARDLRDAREAAHEAAELVDDGGSCNHDGARLFGVRWGLWVQRAADQAGVRVIRSKWCGRACLDLCLGVPGQGAKRTRGYEAAVDLLRARHWDASVFYMVD